MPRREACQCHRVHRDCNSHTILRRGLGQGHQRPRTARFQPPPRLLQNRKPVVERRCVHEGGCEIEGMKGTKTWNESDDLEREKKGKRKKQYGDGDSGYEKSRIS